MNERISLLTKEEILLNPNYINNMEQFLAKCEEEYKEEIKKRNDNLLVQQQLNKKIIPKDNNSQEKLSFQKTHNTKSNKSLKNVDYYYNDLLQVTELAELEIILPPRDNFLFSKVINLLILKLLKNIDEYYYLRKLEKNEAEKEKISQIISNLAEKKEWLIFYRDYEEEVTIQYSNDEKPTYLIFMKNDYGNFTIEADFKKITSNEYKKDILQCLENLKNNTQKTYKFFSSMQGYNLAGVSEVFVNPRCRIIFDRYENEQAKFVLISSIIQKNTINSYYKLALSNRHNQFKTFKTQFIKQLQEKPLTELITESDNLWQNLNQTFNEGVKYVRTIDQN